MMQHKKLALLLTLFAVLCLGAQPGWAQAPLPLDNYCRFGIGAPKGPSGYDLTLLGVGAYLDWSSTRNSQVPDSIRFFHVLRVSDSEYPETLATLPDRINQYPAAVWIIGNEPDAEVKYQDHVTAQVYAQRYFALATRIRELDPNAIIGFGPIIQPTPVRMYYLTQALAELGKMTSSPASLIDVVAIHNFLLNEEPIYRNGIAVNWGAGVPPGYVEGVWPAPQVIRIGGENDETYKTHDKTTFENRIKAFRVWMKEHNLRDKPLWITEYGSLFPSVGNLYLTVSEADTASFLQQTMDFMLSAIDSNFGYSPDDNRLVQHFVWYSLNEDRWRFGGSLYAPDNKQLTLVGETFLSYEPPISANLPRKPADLYVQPGSLSVFPIGRTSPDLVNYRVVVRAGNAIASEYHTQVRLNLYDNGVLLGTQTVNLPRCSGQALFNFLLTAQQVGALHTFRAELTLLGGNGPESYPANDSLTFPTLAVPPIYQYILPLIKVSGF